MKPRRPIQAVARCTPGLSNNAPNFAPSLLLIAVKVKRKKKIMVNAMEIAMKTGVVAVGADSNPGVLEGSTDKSTKFIETKLAY